MSATRQQRQRPPKAEEPTTPPDPDPDEHDDEEPEQTPEPAVEPGDPDAQRRKIDNARRKYRKDLEGIVGDLTGAVGCPMCDGLGFVDASGRLERRSDTEECASCRGHGFMLTGSKVEGQSVLPCPVCTGSGYTPKRVEGAPPPTNVVELPPPAAQQVHGWFDATTQTFHPYSEVAPS